MANYVYIATSLDGYIATPDGGIDWLHEDDNPELGDFGYADFMANIDAIVMGRGTYEKVLTFNGWPYEKPVIVLSTRLSEVPAELHDRVKLRSEEPETLVERLTDAGYTNLYIDGGITIQRFLQADLIDELTITRLPILLGDGIPLFGHLDRHLRFKHVKTEAFGNSLVQSHYVRRRDG